MSNENNDLKETQNMNSNFENENNQNYVDNDTNIEKANVLQQENQKQLALKSNEESNKFAQQSTVPSNIIIGKTQNVLLEAPQPVNVNYYNYNQNNCNVAQNQQNQNQIIYLNNNAQYNNMNKQNKESNKDSEVGSVCLCAAISAGVMACCYFIFSCLQKDKRDD